MSSTRRRSRRSSSGATRGGQDTTPDVKASLKKSSETIDEQQNHIKMFIYGKTGCGTTYGALHILRTPQFEGDLIYINNDVPQNLRDNVRLLTEEEQARLVIPHTSDGSDYMRVTTRNDWLAVWKALEEEYGDFSSCAGIVLDYVENLYDGYIAEWNPQTPFAYGTPRKYFYDEVLAPLMNAKTNVVIIGKEAPIYVDVGQGEQFAKHLGQYQAFWDGSKALEKWKVDFNFIIYRETLFRDERSKVHYRTIFEKHKLGIDPIIVPHLDDPENGIEAVEDSNLFNVFYQYYLDKQAEIRS